MTTITTHPAGRFDVCQSMHHGDDTPPATVTASYQPTPGVVLTCHLCGDCAADMTWRLGQQHKAA